MGYNHYEDFYTDPNFDEKPDVCEECGSNPCRCNEEENQQDKDEDGYFDRA